VPSGLVQELDTGIARALLSAISIIRFRRDKKHMSYPKRRLVGPNRNGAPRRSISIHERAEVGFRRLLVRLLKRESKLCRLTAPLSFQWEALQCWSCVRLNAGTQLGREFSHDVINPRGLSASCSGLLRLGPMWSPYRPAPGLDPASLVSPLARALASAVCKLGYSI
jgi:hypothetical protein